MTSPIDKLDALDELKRSLAVQPIVMPAACRCQSCRECLQRAGHVRQAVRATDA